MLDVGTYFAVHPTLSPFIRMAISPEYALEVSPRTRFDITDVNGVLREQYGDVLARYPRALYASYHTTAGYFEQQVCHALEHSADSIQDLVEAYRALYPEGAGYRHDNLALRDELTDEQKEDEPLNGDSHLTFIGSGLLNCVTYDVHPGTPAYFVDLDGVYRSTRRQRKTTVVGFDREVLADRTRLRIPATTLQIDALNLRDEKLGVFDELNAHVRRLGIHKGRIDLRLPDEEQHAALTVNEYETLLMRHDLAEVLHNPFRFMAMQGWNVLRDPLAVPSKALNYAKYDFVVVVNKLLKKLRLRGTPVEYGVERLIGKAARKRLHMKRRVSLPISDHNELGVGAIVQGTYQSPILVQWRRPLRDVRALDVQFVAFE